MEPATTTEIAFCPRCFCPLKIRERYQVDFCSPFQPPFPPVVPPNQGPVSNSAVNPLLPSEPQQDNAPAPPPQQDNAPAPPSQQDEAPAPPPERTNRSEAPERRGTQTAHDETRRSSASSSSSLHSAFSEWSINTGFGVELQAAEAAHFSQRPFQASSPPPPPTSSPSTESSVTLSATPTSSPSTESSLTQSTSDVPPSTVKRWVVFRGRLPGVYTSS